MGVGRNTCRSGSANLPHLMVFDVTGEGGNVLQDGRDPDLNAQNIMALTEELNDPDTDRFFGHVSHMTLAGPFGAGLMVQRNCPGGEFESPPFDDFHVHVLMQGGRKTYDRFDGVVRNNDATPGQIALTRPDVAGEIAVEGTFSSIHVSLPKPIFQRTSDMIGDGRPPNLDALFEIIFHDPWIFWMAQELNHGSLNGAGHDTLFTDEVFWSLSSKLMQRAGTLKIAQRKARPLDLRAFKRVHNLFMERFETPLTVQDLADTVDMDAFTFSRGFKARTGRSPYQYLLQLRVDRALHMLLSTETSLIEIAYSCGFSSQAHFTTVFRRITGLTPGAARALR